MLGNARAASPAEAVVPRTEVALAPRTKDVAARRATVPQSTLDMAGLTLDVVTTRAAFDALETDWNELFARAGRSIHVFQTFNWCWHWCNHFLGEASATRLHVVTIRRNGRLALVWPLVLQRSPVLSRLSFLGEPVTQYGDAIVEDADDKALLLEAAWSHVVTHSGADALHLRRVRADSNLASLLATNGAAVSELLQAPYLDLASAPDYASYEMRYSNKARKNRRRMLRRFEERAPAILETLSHGARARELAELAILLKRAWLKNRGLVSPALRDARTCAFFSAVAAAEQRPAGCRVTNLETRGESTAIEISFDCKGRRAVHVLVFALKYERTSPGQLLIERSVRDCFDSGIQIYDLMTPADDYKLDWADAAIDVADWTHALTTKGRLYTEVYIARVRPFLKRAANNISRGLSKLRSSRTRKPPPADQE